jgi:hypothetical protein
MRGCAFQAGRRTCGIREIPASADSRGNGADDILPAQQVFPHKFQDPYQHCSEVATGKRHPAKTLSPPEVGEDRKDFSFFTGRNHDTQRNPEIRFDNEWN